MKYFFKLKTFIIVFLFLVVSILISVSIVFFTKDNHKIVRAGTGDNVTGFAWSDTIGWISFNSTDCDTDDNGYIDTDEMVLGCGGDNTSDETFDYGVNILQSDGNFSGYAWSENIGWISFMENDPPNFDFSGNCIDSLSCNDANDNCTACYHSGDGGVYGWAKILSLGADGWLKLSDDGVTSWSGNGVKISSNEFIGWAWNGNDDSEVGIGWVSFNCLNESPPCDSIDYKVSFAGGSAAVGAPAAPSGLWLEIIDCVSVKMRWIDESDNEDNFETQWSPNGSSGWTTHDPDLNPGVEQRTISQSEKSTIYYQVRAKNSYGNSNWEPISGGEPGTTDYCAPSLSAVSEDCNSIKLTWTYGGPGDYEIRRSVDGAWDGTVVTVLEAEGKTYTDTNTISPDSTYGYRITALGPDPDLESNETTAITPCPSLPTWIER